MRYGTNIYHILLIVLSLTLSLSLVFGGDWYDIDWNNRKNHTINGSTTSLTQYQVKIIVHSGFGTDKSNHIYCEDNCNDDFSDVRFTTSNGTEELDYFLESYSSDNATFWVELDSLPSDQNTSIYVYYGNPDITSTTSDPGNTFDYWSDFSGTTDFTQGLASTNFVTGYDGDANGGLMVNNSGDYGRISTNLNIAYDHVFETWARIPPNNPTSALGGLFFGGQSIAQDGYQAIIDERTDQPDIQVRVDFDYGTTEGGTVQAVIETDKWFFLQAKWKNTGEIDYSVYNSSSTVTAWDEGPLLDSMIRTDTSYSTGEFGVGVYDNITVDKYRVRKYTEPEPISLDTYDSSPNIPYFTSFTFDDDFSVPLDEIDLTPGGVEKVWCNGTAEDEDGFSDLDAVQGYLYSNSSSLESSDHRRTHYTDPDCTTATWNTDGSFACEFDVYFFAEPANWTCYVNVSDNDGFSNSTNETTIIQDMIAINISPDVIDFGEVKIGEDTGTEDIIVNVSNLGNVPFDIKVDTYNFSADSSDAMNCTKGSIPVDSVRINITPGQDYSFKSPVPDVGDLTLDLNHTPQQEPLGLEVTTKQTYWGIGVPEISVDDGGASGTCSGFMKYEAITDN